METAEMIKNVELRKWRRKGGVGFESRLSMDIFYVLARFWRAEHRIVAIRQLDSGQGSTDKLGLPNKIACGEC
jgi:hypothetical protein